jgi:exonuclease VII large subunit
MKEERDARIRLEAENAAMRQQRQPQPQQPVYVDPNQLQALVDQGRITPMQAADILSKQNAQVAAVQTTQQAVQMQALAQKLQAASTEVNQYIDKMPTLRDTTSAEFARVRDEAYRLSEDMGLPVQDLRVQRAALRATFGSLDRLASAQHVKQQSREASLPHVETRTGAAPQRPASGAADEALKGVPQAYLDYWTKKGYTRAQMIEEAQYVTREPRTIATPR